MMERLIDGQEGALCLSFAFGLHEIHRTLSRLRERDAAPETIAAAVKRVMLEAYLDFLSNLEEGLRQRHGGGLPPDGGRVYGLPLARLYELKRFILEAGSLAELLGIDARIGAELGVRLMGQHQTKAFLLAPDYLEARENAYWIEMIRDPYERIPSEVMAAPTAKFIDVLHTTTRHFEFVSGFRHPRYRVVRFEQVMSEPDKELARISEFLGFRIENRPLRNEFGEPFFPNTSLSVLEGGHFMDQNPKYASRIGGKKESVWASRIDPRSLAMIDAGVDTCGWYPRRTSSPGARLAGRLSVRALEAREVLRSGVNRLAGLAGLAVVRADPDAATLAPLGIKLKDRRPVR